MHAFNTTHVLRDVLLAGSLALCTLPVMAATKDSPATGTNAAQAAPQRPCQAQRKSMVHLRTALTMRPRCAPQEDSGT